jgi:hypothetical protein
MGILNRILFPARLMDRLCGKATASDWYEPPVSAWFATVLDEIAQFGKR